MIWGAEERISWSPEKENGCKEEDEENGCSRVEERRRFFFLIFLILNI